MKPRWKSVWMTPAASGAVAPAGIVHARVSLGPAVRKVCRPSVRKPARASWARPGSPRPASASSSAASSSGSSARSASVLASRKIPSAGATRADSRSRRPGSASSSVSALKTYRNGLAVSSWNSRRSTRSIPAEAPPANSVVPVSRSFCALPTAFATRIRIASLPDFVSLASRGVAFSSVCRSARISSVTTVSMSRSGDTSPSTWLTSGSLNTRTTWHIASVSRMWPRNWLPSPWPWAAPRTSPAMSTNRTVAGTIRAESYSLASSASRGSGTPTMPTFGSMVANG